ncbi:MAG: hypothetical protein IPM06_19060 [Rhizobiales bacterium]|nr:hypothetical protein [Hyphomicrobiales bacterium]
MVRPLLRSGVGGGLLGFVGGASLTATITQTIDDLDKLNEAAERIGVTVEDLSALISPAS